LAMSELRAWHSVSAGVVERELETSASSGLTSKEARARRGAYGPESIRSSRLRTTASRLILGVDAHRRS
jgi:hypothetical protein